MKEHLQVLVLVVAEAKRAVIRFLRKENTISIARQNSLVDDVCVETEVVAKRYDEEERNAQQSSPMIKHTNKCRRCC